MGAFFLSYARSDRALARSVVEICERTGHAVWWDSRLTGSTIFRSVVDRRINTSAAVIALWTAKSSVSPWVIAEAEHGHALMRLVNVCGPDLPPERIPKPFSVYNILHWQELHRLPEVLEQGYFGMHVDAEDTRPLRRDATKIPFLDILDELYAYHAIAVRQDKEGLGKYLRRFPEGAHVAYAARKLSELVDAPAEKTPALEDSESRIVELLRGVRHDGQPFWAYVAVLPSKHGSFEAMKEIGNIDLHNFLDWGEVVSAGIGEWPSHTDNEYVSQRFNIPLSSLFDPPNS